MLRSLRLNLKGGASFDANPKLKGLVSAATSFLSETTKTITTTTEDGFPKWVGILAILITIGLFVWYLKKRAVLETPSNIRRITLNSLKASDVYSTKNRKTLRDYIDEIAKQGVPGNHLSLTNFYLSTVNTTGLFFPAEDGVFSPDAARVAAKAGARAFVFDIWPDLRAGGQFGPILQTVDPGSQWRRISLNSYPFQAILTTALDTIFKGGMNPNGTFGTEDFVVFYLRFRGVPRASTYTGVAAALRATMEQYRLDSSYYACRGEDRLFRTPVTELFQKVIVCANTRAMGTPLQDYINSAPSDGIRTEWWPNDINALTDAMKGEQIIKIQQHLTFSMYSPEEERAATNNWDWKESHAIGVHCAALNFFQPSPQLVEYMKPELFGVYSYKIKPEKLRYVIDMLPKPGVPQNPGWGSGPTAGTPVIPDPIKYVR